MASAWAKKVVNLAPLCGVCRRLESVLGNLSRGKSLPVNWLAKIAPVSIVPDTDETPAIVPWHLWELGADRAKLLVSTKSERKDDEDGNAGWKLVLYFGPGLFLFSWIVQSVLDARKRKVASLHFEPNALRSIGSVNGEEQCKPYGALPALDKFAGAFSIAGEPQQKAADEKKEATSPAARKNLIRF